MDTDQLFREISFKAVRSSGAGGQHVNKVSTKVILVFDLIKSKAFTEEEKSRLYKALKNRLTKDNLLVIQAGDTRSQIKNREIAQQRLFNLLNKGLEVQKERKKTRPTKSSVEKRLKTKRKVAEKKSGRKKPDLE